MYADRVAGGILQRYESRDNMGKIYDKELHHKARGAEIAVLNLIKYSPEIFNKSMFGFPTHCGDIDFKKDIITRIFDIEVEWRQNHWKSGQTEFPYKTVTIPGRKLKKIHSQMLYFCVREDCKKALMFFGKEILEYKKLVIKNTFYTEGEEFIEIPTSMGIYFLL